jgi:triosephosphate isomerase
MRGQIMATAPRPLIAGNWKMNGWQRSGAELTRIIEGSRDFVTYTDLLVCPPATLVASFAALVTGTSVMIGGQDCHAEAFGAFTGDIAAEMLKDAGASAVIVGHSERRTYHQETDAEVEAKARAAWRAELNAIVCIGETKEERVGGRTLDVVGGQLQNSVPDGATAANTVIAYEPVWAIGTGLTPTPADVAEVHGFIRERLTDRFGAAGQAMRILYGGSVKPSNAAELMRVKNVNGALVGGASLKAEDFLGIARVYR